MVNIADRDEEVNYAGSINNAFGKFGSASPIINSTRWTKLCDWAKIHKTELLILASVICMIASLALVVSGPIALAVAATVKTCTILFTLGLPLGMCLAGLGGAILGVKERHDEN